MIQTTSSGAVPDDVILKMLVTNSTELTGPLQKIEAIIQTGLDKLAAAVERTAGTAESASNKKDQTKGKRGPNSMPLENAWKYLSIVGEWAQIQEENQKLPQKKRRRKFELAYKHDLSVKELDAMLSWYGKHRRAGKFPKDPRKTPPSEPGRLFVCP